MSGKRRAFASALGVVFSFGYFARNHGGL